MTNPADPLVRLANLEAAFAKAGPRLDAIESALSNGGAAIAQTNSRLDEAIAGVTPVVSRVEELSAAAVAFNDRLNRVEQTIAEWIAQNPAGDDRIEELSAKLATAEQRISAIEQTRLRGGRLSSRLASIESKLDQVLTPKPEQPEEEPSNGNEPVDAPEGKSSGLHAAEG